MGIWEVIMAIATRTYSHAATHTIPVHAVDIDHTKRLEQATLDLEDAVFSVLDAHKGYAFHDVDFLYWDRKLKNVATPISLALSECKGPRQFHFHYRHDPKDTDKMIPVLESPLHTLAKVCRDALIRCNEMVGMIDRSVIVNKIRLEQALRGFISKYNDAAVD